MAEIANFVHRNAMKITPKILDNIMRELPLLKAEFTQINAPKFPHLVDQLEFLADAVEDFAEGQVKDLPYFAIAEAAFAMIYAHRMMDLIPDTTAEYGYADDSAVVRSVLIRYQSEFQVYAVTTDHDWSKITDEP
ncbi:MAG: hypothetical protein AAGA18_04570 [Verrucomicrobiota bacterium]